MYLRHAGRRRATHEWHLNLPDEPVEVVADRSQIQRVILNLLSNARKHTDEGTRVTAGLAVDAAHREAVVTVTDNGPGITPDFLPKIFDRFTRADKARSGSDGPPAWAWRLCRRLCRRTAVRFRCRASRVIRSLRCVCLWRRRAPNAHARWLTRWLARWFAERVVGWVFGRSGVRCVPRPFGLRFLGFIAL